MINVNELKRKVELHKNEMLEIFIKHIKDIREKYALDFCNHVRRNFNEIVFKSAIKDQYYIHFKCGNEYSKNEHYKFMFEALQYEDKDNDKDYIDNLVKKIESYGYKVDYGILIDGIRKEDYDMEYVYDLNKIMTFENIEQLYTTPFYKANVDGFFKVSWDFSNL